MEIVPVIDLMDGLVVHARRGQRERYAPLRSRLCAGSRPQDVARALAALHPFRALYAADLDAILERGSHLALLEALGRELAPVELWVDAGVRDLARWRRLAAGGLTPVVGSETLPDLRLLEALAGEAHAFVLSLDFRQERLLGPAELLERPELWPSRVIALNLDRVGARRGPDLALAGALAARAPGARIYCAGGVRGKRDLEALTVRGFGALIASALHDGSLTREDLETL
ncbi:MAG: nickel transporter [Burkholderiales bacterium]|nr:MAG: nickel transporter [Burkholderiales bacterium]